MEDNQIIELYWNRNEKAISETDKKYGKYCNYIAYNILQNSEDAKECMNETYLKTWNSIPPQRPKVFKLFIAKITRNLAIDIYRKNKHKSVMEDILDELSECTSNVSIDNEIEYSEILKNINIFLDNGKIENITPKEVYKIFELMQIINEIDEIRFKEGVRLGIKEGNLS